MSHRWQRNGALHLNVVVQGCLELVTTGCTGRISVGIIGRLHVNRARTEIVGVVTALEVGQNGGRQQYY